MISHNRGKPTLVVQLDEIADLVGQTFRGSARVVDREAHDNFKIATWLDEVYVDEPRSDEHPEELVAGFHSLALLDALRCWTIRLDPSRVYGLNYGLNRVRFTSPIFVGDAIVPEFKLVSAEPRENGLLLTWKCALLVPVRNVTALVAEWVVLAAPRTKDD